MSEFQSIKMNVLCWKTPWFLLENRLSQDLLSSIFDYNERLAWASPASWRQNCGLSSRKKIKLLYLVVCSCFAVYEFRSNFAFLFFMKKPPEVVVVCFFSFNRCSVRCFWRSRTITSRISLSTHAPALCTCPVKQGEKLAKTTNILVTNLPDLPYQF